MDTMDLAIGITNIRFKVYTFTSSTYALYTNGYNFSPLGLDGLSFDIQITDWAETFEPAHPYFPA
jgi:hypothetical protein